MHIKNFKDFSLFLMNLFMTQMEIKTQCSVCVHILFWYCHMANVSMLQIHIVFQHIIYYFMALVLSSGPHGQDVRSIYVFH